MDEEKKKIEPNIIDVLKQKAAVENQLDTFINPIKPKTDDTASISYYNGDEIKTQPLIKIKDIPETSEAQVSTPISTQAQNRPIIRTYKSDVEETIQTSHMSSINIALAENRKMMGQLKNTEIETKKKGINKNILIISLVLIFGGLLTIFIPQLIINMQYVQKKAPVETVSPKPIITADVEVKINITGINQSDIDNVLRKQADNSSATLGQIENIYITTGTSTNERIITASEFMQLINSNVPSEIQRTLKDQYMFGTYNYNGNQKFLILKVGEYDITFSGMLAWETNLWQDFKQLFGLPENNASSSNPFAMETKKFTDATFNNKDCRVVKDDNGNVIFLYSIIDNNTVVITTSIDTLKEIINRVSKSRIVTQ